MKPCVVLVCIVYVAAAIGILLYAAILGPGRLADPTCVDWCIGYNIAIMVWLIIPFVTAPFSLFDK